MKKLSSLEEEIYNAGERLIPGVTHNTAEVVRHRNSYLFFRRVIENDVARWGTSRPIRIVDLGCGVGHGCEVLSRVPNSQVVGVDSSPQSIKYARAYYQGDNITYNVADLLEYIPVMPEYDYVVSRNVFEHLPNGLQLALSTKWRHRLLFDVPYNESLELNPHHEIHEIREENFAKFPTAELFFQDLDGLIHQAQRKPSRPNVLLCVCSSPRLPSVSATPMNFPFMEWHPPFYRQVQALRRNAFLKRLRNRLRERVGGTSTSEK